MKNQLDTLRATRKNILKIVEPLSMEQLNVIPKGFNNNLIWNLGHVLATQQLLVYGLSGLPTKMDAEIIDRYRKGTKPDGVVAQEEYDLFKRLTHSTIDEVQADWDAGLFTKFKEYPTSFGIVLTDAAHAIEFNNVHEAMHLGTMIALKKMI